MSEQVFDVRGALGSLRHHRWAVALCVLIGALIPVGLMLWRPPPYSATAVVLVPSAPNPSGGSSSSSPSANSNVTDSEIAVSSAVLGNAGARVSPPVTFQEAKQWVKASAVATNLVQITASAPKAHQAQALANAVANRLVTFVTSYGTSSGTTALTGLQGEATQLTKQIKAYDAQIATAQARISADAPGSGASQQDTQLLGSLTSAQSGLELQLQTVSGQIAAAKINMAAENGGTEVIQYASTAAPPSTLRRVVPVLAGGLIGFLVSAVFFLSRRRNRKLTSRDEIAEAVGVPVVLSLSVGRWKASSDWLGLLSKSRLPMTELWNVNKALSHLDLPEDGQPIVTVISLARDTPSVAAAAHLAVASASMEVPTSLVLTSDDPSSTGLSNACDLLSARNEVPRPNLKLFKGSAPVEDAATALTVISIVLDPEQPKLPAYVARGVVVIAVSASNVDQEQLARVLVAVGQEGLSIKGVLVTNPTGGDRTSGVIPDAGEQVSQILRRRTLDPLPETRAGGAETR